MLAFIVVIIIVFIVAYFSNAYARREEIKRLADSVQSLIDETRDLKTEIKGLKAQATLPLKEPEKVLPKKETPLKREFGIGNLESGMEEKVLPEEVSSQPILPQQPETPPVAKEPELEPVVPRIPHVPRPLPANEPEPVVPRRAAATAAPVPAAGPYKPEESWFDQWLRNNPDLEKFIGENLVNKIGIAVLVLGIAFFVKYAIDKDWINEVGRVSIGLVCGAGLIALAHYLRNAYRSFSSVLAGGGIAVFYFTIAFAFHEYNLMPQTAAFLIMVMITGFAVALSLLYDKLELAVIATIGGFLTPFLVSTGQGNYIVLFSYLVILNAGLLSLSYFKRWPLINIISLFFTVIIFGGWLFTTLHDRPANVSYPLALLFATVLYLIFLGMNMVHQVRKAQAFKPFDFFILLFLTATYFTAGMVLLNQVQDGKFQGLFTLAQGLLNLSLARYFFKRKDAARNLLYLLIGLTLTFISLAIPVQMHGHAITLFWSAEFVLLYWLYQRSGIRLFKYSSALVSLLTLSSLLMDWSNAAAGSVSSLALIFTDLKGIVTNVVAAAAFAAYRLLLQKEKADDEYINGLTNNHVRKAAWVLSAALFYLTLMFGVNLYFRSFGSYEVPNVYHRLVTEGFVLALVFWLQRKKAASAGWLQIAAIGIYFLYNLFSTPLIISLRNGVLAGNFDRAHLWMHWFSGLVMMYLFYKAISIIRKNPDVFKEYYDAFAWVISIAAVITISIGFRHIYLAAGHGKYSTPELLHQYSKAVLTILWALCSFALMWLGMKHRTKTLRIVSLSLFSLALLKLFFYDIRGISEGGKITAFILLGVLLLTTSFMYQKLKKIVSG